MTTTSQSFSSVAAHGWRELYRLALFETDRRQLPARLDEAERALARRAGELFSTPDNNSDEVQAIDVARYALRALRNNLKLGTTEAEAERRNGT